MGVDDGEHFLHNRATSVATLRGPFAFGSDLQGSTLASQLSDTQNCEGPHAPRSFRRGKQAQFAHCQNTRPGSRVSKELDAIIQAAIKKMYLVVEQPQITAVIEEVNLQCFKAKLKRPGVSTIRRRICAGSAER
jgi:hypothetical protein